MDKLNILILTAPDDEGFIQGVREACEFFELECNYHIGDKDSFANEITFDLGVINREFFKRNMVHRALEKRCAKTLHFSVGSVGRAAVHISRRESRVMEQSPEVRKSAAITATKNMIALDQSFDVDEDKRSLILSNLREICAEDED